MFANIKIKLAPAILVLALVPIIAIACGGDSQLEQDEYNGIIDSLETLQDVQEMLQDDINDLKLVRSQLEMDFRAELTRLSMATSNLGTEFDSVSNNLYSELRGVQDSIPVDVRQENLDTIYRTLVRSSCEMFISDIQGRTQLGHRFVLPRTITGHLFTFGRYNDSCEVDHPTNRIEDVRDTVTVTGRVIDATSWFNSTLEGFRAGCGHRVFGNEVLTPDQCVRSVRQSDGVNTNTDIEFQVFLRRVEQDLRDIYPTQYRFVWRGEPNVTIQDDDHLFAVYEFDYDASNGFGAWQLECVNDFGYPDASQYLDFGFSNTRTQIGNCRRR